MLQGYLDRVRTVYGGKFLYALSDRGAATCTATTTGSTRSACSS